MTIFFTADLHFNHKRIIEFTKRPWSNIEEMNKAIVDIWNSQVSDEDTVYILGDFCFAPREDFLPLWNSLNGHKVLIKGNHDYKIPDGVEYYNFLEKKIEGRLVTMSHYPLLQWKDSEYGSIHLHGHLHGKREQLEERVMDVGFDVDERHKLFTWDEVKRRLLKYPPQARH